MPSQVELLFLSMFGRFLVPTSIPVSFKIIVFPLEKRWFFKKSPLEDNIDFCSILEANMPPFSFQNPQKSFKNPILRGIKILIVFCFDFQSILAPFWEPSWSHVAHQDAPKTLPRRAQDGSKIPRGPQEAPRLPQGASKMPPRSPKRLPRGLQG